MDNKFEIGDIVILKSQKGNENAIKMTICRIDKNSLNTTCHYAYDGKIEQVYPNLAELIKIT